MLVLEEHIYPSQVGKDPMSLKEFKYLTEALKVNEVESVNLEFALNTLVQSKDTDHIEYKQFTEAIDEQRLVLLIEQYDVIVLMGSRLVELVLGKKLKDIYGIVQEIDGKYYLPLYSNYYLSKNRKSITQEFTILLSKVNNLKQYCEYETVLEIERLREVISYCQDIVCIDIETTDLRYFDKKQKWTSISIQYQPGYAYVVPIEHEDFDWFEDFKEVISLIGSLLSNYNVTKVGHNLKYELHWFRRYGLTVIRGRLADTMLMSQLLNENRKHGLKSLVKEFFPYYSNYDEKVNFNGPFEQLARYNSIDTDVTLRLFYIFEHDLLKDGHEKLYRLLRNLKVPAIKALEDIEYRGAKISKELLIKYRTDAEERLKIKFAEILEFDEVKRFNKFLNESTKGDTDLVINLVSPKQVATLLFDFFEFDLPIVDGKPTRTTNKDAISQIDHIFIQKLSAYRSIQSMINTYYNGILERLDDDGYLHTNFNIIGTVTGRLSSSDPNLQNIPARSSVDDEDATTVLKNIKKFFVIADGYTAILQEDFSQAELRMIANVCNDSNMVEAYKQGKDLHMITAAAILGISVEDWEKLPSEEKKRSRTNAKGANFGWVYKASLKGYVEFLKTNYGITINLTEAQIHKNAIFNTYPGIQKWHDAVEYRMKKLSYMEDLFGFRRRFYNFNNSTNQGLINKDLRDAVNNPIQGSIGQLALFSIVLLYNRLGTDDVRIWTTVHDSMIYYIRDNINEYMDIIHKSSEEQELYTYFGIREMPVKFTVDYAIGESWRDLVEIGGINKFLSFLN